MSPRIAIDTVGPRPAARLSRIRLSLFVARAFILAFLVSLTVSPALALRTAETINKPAPSKTESTATPLGQLQERASYWSKPERRILSYWINIRSFCHAEANPAAGCAQADTIAANLATAMKDWMNACPECGIRFERVERRENAVFAVQYITQTLDRTRDSKLQRRYVPPRYTAHAFYPSSAPESRVLRISSRYRTDHPDYDAVGVLRHEIGHILGYTHEHTAADGKKRALCGWAGEGLPAGIRALAITEYDPQSVMHYPCKPLKEKGTFTLSPRDVAGHRALYGPRPQP